MRHSLAGFFNATKPVSYAYRNTANPPNAYLSAYFSHHAVSNSDEVYATYGYNSQMAIIKHTNIGDIEWLKLLNVSNPASNFNRGISTVIDSAGYCYFLGLYQVIISGISYQRPVIFKYTSSGDLVWAYEYYMVTTKDEAATSLYIDSNNFLYIVGQGRGNNVFPNNDSDIFLLKLDNSGNIIFSRRYQIAGRNDTANKITVDTAGNIYICGYYSAGFVARPLLLKLDPNGAISWTRVIRDPNYSIEDGSSDGIITSVQIDASGDIYCSGRHRSDLSAPVVNPANAAVWKFNSSGDLIWQRCLKYPLYSSSGGVAIDSTGSVIINGHASNGPGYFDPTYGFFAKFDPSGALQWQRFFYLKDGSESNVQYLVNVSLAVKNDQMYGLFPYSYRDPAIGTYYGTILASLRTDGVELVNSDVNYAAGSPTLVTPLFIAQSLSYTTPTSTWTRSAITTSETTITDFSGNLLKHFFY